MRDRKDEGSLVPRAGHDSAQQDKDNKPGEERSADEGEEESEYYLYRLERLLQLDQHNELPTLDPVREFMRGVCNRSMPAITKEQFERRLERFLKDEDPHFPALSSELVDFRFNRAVGAYRHITAWELTVESVKGPAFDGTRSYLQQELDRYVSIRRRHRRKRREAPSWMSPWVKCWVEAFEEVLDQIEGALRGAGKLLGGLSRLRKSGRVEIESYVLWLEKIAIRKQIANTAFKRKIELLLPAFAYAAKLVLPKPGKDTIGYRASVKQRVSRASRKDKKHIEPIVVLLLATLSQESNSAPKVRP